MPNELKEAWIVEANTFMGWAVVAARETKLFAEEELRKTSPLFGELRIRRYVPASPACVCGHSESSHSIQDDGRYGCDNVYCLCEAFEIEANTPGEAK